MQHHVNQVTSYYFINLSEKQVSCIQELSLCCHRSKCQSSPSGLRLHCHRATSPCLANRESAHQASRNSLMPVRTKLEDNLRVGSLHDHRSWPSMVGPFHQRWFPVLCPEQVVAQLPIKLGTEQNAALEEVADEIFDLGFSAQALEFGFRKT